MIANVIDVTENCRHSLMCRHQCPVGNITRVETLTPHGWAQLVALERRGISSWNPSTVDALYKCADCGNCRSHCVTDQPLPEGIAAARAVVVERDLAPPIVYELAEILREWENPFVRERPLAGAGRGEVALFVGDEAHHLRPGLIDAAVRLLAHLGVEPVLIGRGRSNGYLASSLGLPAVARELALANLAELESTGARRLLLLSPGDFFAFRQMYDERLGVEIPAGVELLEMVPFLARQLESGALRPRREEDGAPYAYVDPTHSVRVKERFAAPRALLSAIMGTPPRELFWREDRAYPAGDLALQFTQPQLADALSQFRLSDAASTGAQAVVSEAAGTLVHLERHSAALGMRVLGLYELLADRLTT